MKYRYAYTCRTFETDWTERKTEDVLEYLKENYRFITINFRKLNTKITISKNYCKFYRYSGNVKKVFDTVKTINIDFAKRYIKAAKGYCDIISITDKKGNTFIFYPW